MIASVCGQEIPKNIQEKKELLLSHNIAVWDVIQSCDITGSSDSSIKNVVANDISKIVSESKIEKIYTNGKKAYQLYEKYILPDSGIDAICLPSTSPANSAWNLEKLVMEWSKIKK